MVDPSRAPIKPQSIAGALLAWYDLNRRILPWRALPGESADPYHVWLSEIMLQQTGVEAVKPYFLKFLARWPDVQALADAEDQAVLAAWAGLGYYARARNLLACARAIARDHGGKFPETEAELRKLPGIGTYTAAAITAIAFGRPALVIDGNVERVISRLSAIATPLPVSRPEIREALSRIAPSARPGDFAQGMMDLGSGICKPKSPQCLLCPLRGHCKAYRSDDPARFPCKMPKKSRPTRTGIAFVAVDEAGCVLLRSRPPKGLLGGMSEVPTSAWEVHPAPSNGLPHAPLHADWQVLNREVIHVFTHFELRLMVHLAHVSSMLAPKGCRWVSRSALEDEPLPTLMRKVLEAAGVQ